MILPRWMAWWTFVLPRNYHQVKVKSMMCQRKYLHRTPCYVVVFGRKLMFSFWLALCHWCWWENRKDGTARQDLNIRCHWHVPTWCSTSNKTTKTLTITTANLPSGNEVSRYHVIRMCVHDLQCIFKILYANLQQPTRSYGTHLDMLNCSTVGEFNAQTTMESNTYADTGTQKTNVQVLYI